MKDCIFCKIINGESPCWKIYEDDLVIAFFDKFPAIEGHTLIATKKHFENIYDIPDKYIERIAKVCKKLAIHYKKVFGMKAINIIHGSGKEAQQDVFHFHFHLIPRKDAQNDNFKMYYNPKDKEISKKFDLILKKIKNHPDFKKVANNK